MDKYKDLNNFVYIDGFLGLYKINKDGCVYSCRRNIIMKNDLRNGYKCVHLQNNGFIIHKYIHRLVAEAFIPNPKNKTQVDHINTIRTDNRVENLRWVTAKENINNEITLSKHIGSKRNKKTIEKMRKSQKTMKPVMCLNTGEKFISLGEAQRKKNIYWTNIRKVCLGERKTAGGLEWIFC